MSQENVDLVSGGYDDFNSGNIESLTARFAPDIEWHEPGGGNAPSGTYRGPESVANESHRFANGSLMLTRPVLDPDNNLLGIIFLQSSLDATYSRLRRDVGMALAVSAAGSLLIIGYLHASDLCLWLAAGWIVWHQRPQPAWRAVLAGLWVIAIPFLEDSAMAPALNRWVMCELLVLAAFAVDAFAPATVRSLHGLLTGLAASWRRAPA